MNKLTTLGSFLLVFVAVVSCTKETNITNEINIMPYASLEQRYTEGGWHQFVAGNYAQAVDSFKLAVNANSLYSDAYNGLGWSYAKLDSLELAHQNFTIGMVSSTNQQVYKDARAGRSFVNLALSNYQKALEDAVDAISLRQEYYNIYSFKDYAFRHVPTINQLDILLVAAESLYFLQAYELSRDMVLLIDNTLTVSANPEELAIAIEQLKNILG